MTTALTKYDLACKALDCLSEGAAHPLQQIRDDGTGAWRGLIHGSFTQEVAAT
jgi:hypothetical protein